MAALAKVDACAIASETCLIFAYGSLMWRPSFTYKARQSAYVCGYIRRFWQTSDDHRGTKDFPGRVACLLRAEDVANHEPSSSNDDKVWGCMYSVEHGNLQEILQSLDQREQNGYTRTLTTGFDEYGQSLGDCFVYVCCTSHPSYSPMLDVRLIASTIVQACGMSGPNIEYVIKLHACLTDMGKSDEYINLLTFLCKGMVSLN